ncbi:Putative helicase [Candidatus Methylomirabilis lanthanidiphila]|uniref:Helicase n=1 Tax=Candidatus Methylomirabilis lanthanidiphila TaxID=2211376 RepID=A0A564ZH99_9BACT|nr:TraI domain-containing protein [Candidatus Methylomirabilis lanthanidiphila]VUZ84675.1 Putative helicase [Candidatus Methylomirabilis lanthanidiphila]
MDLVEQSRQNESTPLDNDFARLADLIRQIQVPYRELVERAINDPSCWTRFCRAPASTDHHHAHVGGLLRHTIEVMEFGIKPLPLLPVKVNPSLLLTAGLFHDLGKIDAYTEHAPYALTPLGKAWGHQVLGLRGTSCRCWSTLRPCPLRPEVGCFPRSA